MARFVLHLRLRRRARRASWPARPERALRRLPGTEAGFLAASLLHRAGRR
ncbi:MAG: hypothetical protein M3P39_09280 [Actinomycetota bacterium]|nr:hypothetical protein [Actinomycetota bacterium]